MEQLRSFDQLRTNELSIVRDGFFRPSFDLTDGQFSYGKLSYGSLWKTTTILESAQKTWILKRKAIFSRSLLILDENGMDIGVITPELFSRSVKLSLTNGFEAAYAYKKLFSRVFNLFNQQYGDILQVKATMWGYKKPFEITVDLDKLKTLPDMPLLVLVGVNIILIKQAQAAASAGVGG